MRSREPLAILTSPPPLHAPESPANGPLAAAEARCANVCEPKAPAMMKAPAASARMQAVWEPVKNGRIEKSSWPEERACKRAPCPQRSLLRLAPGRLSSERSGRHADQGTRTRGVTSATGIPAASLPWRPGPSPICSARRWRRRGKRPGSLLTRRGQDFRLQEQRTTTAAVPPRLAAMRAAGAEELRFSRKFRAFPAPGRGKIFYKGSIPPGEDPNTARWARACPERSRTISTEISSPAFKSFSWAG